VRTHDYRDIGPTVLCSSQVCPNGPHRSLGTTEGEPWSLKRISRPRVLVELRALSSSSRHAVRILPGAPTALRQQLHEGCEYRVNQVQEQRDHDPRRVPLEPPLVRLSPCLDSFDFPARKVDDWPIHLIVRPLGGGNDAPGSGPC
jgi:hypothetical protein